MNDFNLVQVTAQSESSNYSPQTRMLNIDWVDLSKIAPPLKELKEDSVNILKLYHDYLQQKSKKSHGLPYHMIKRFEHLKISLGKVHHLLQNQCRFFKNEISNRQFQKANEQHFFKKTLLSYDQKRLWMKHYILKNQMKMQEVEEEVKKNVDYETHRFTQFLNTIDLQRLEHNFSPKIDLTSTIGKAIESNIELRYKIKQQLKEKKQKLVNSNQKSSQQSQKQSKKSSEDLQNFRNLVTNSSISTLLYGKLTTLSASKQFLFNRLKALVQSKSNASFNIMQLKVAIDRIVQAKEQNNIEMCITLQQFPKQIKEIWDFDKICQMKLTKTDYIIFLKEIYRQCEQRIKAYGQYFQYSLCESSEFPNSRKSQSVKKHTFLRIPGNKKQHISINHKESIIKTKNFNQNKVEQQEEEKQKQKQIQEHKNPLIDQNQIPIEEQKHCLQQNRPAPQKPHIETQQLKEEQFVLKSNSQDNENESQSNNQGSQLQEENVE